MTTSDLQQYGTRREKGKLTRLAVGETVSGVLLNIREDDKYPQLVMDIKQEGGQVAAVPVSTDIQGRVGGGDVGSLVFITHTGPKGRMKGFEVTVVSARSLPAELLAEARKLFPDLGRLSPIATPKTPSRDRAPTIAEGYGDFVAEGVSEEDDDLPF